DGNRPPDSARRAGHECNVAVERLGHCRRLSLSWELVNLFYNLEPGSETTLRAGEHRLRRVEIGAIGERKRFDLAHDPLVESREHPPRPAFDDGRDPPRGERLNRLDPADRRSSLLRERAADRIGGVARLDVD